ncbi:universal stress protein [Mucilaginibacter sp. L196]|uniref:universal stress protein n=1 Tax=Mucilaginibacter sp. L196 TaxID=1641870 RepID=UPI00131E058C|nr:universal stress protein [Mucilaginibacter sp. L196]
MNKILVMVDFSVNANQIAEYAFKLASCLKMDIVLHCCFQHIVSIPALRGDGWSEESLIVNQNAGIERLRQLSVTTRKLAETFAPDAYLPSVRYQWVNGIFDPLLLNYNQNDKVNLLISGSHQKTPSTLMEDWIKKLVDRTGLTLLLIPPGMEFKPFKKIVFVTMLKEDEYRSVCEVIKFADIFKSEIVLTRVVSNRQVRTCCAKKYFDDLMHLSRYNRISYQERYQDGPPDLTKLSMQIPHDLLALVRRSRSLQNENRAMALQQIAPLLICRKEVVNKPTQL